MKQMHIDESFAELSSSDSSFPGIPKCALYYATCNKLT